ncbi:unnamed protein product [Prorocentrum cordatum]|uniref:Uncharacterized protein n=1 Tax=Prorocentrum cordatum TaxID=2364126 RepID=A0ABN9T783_9DINO|nr:unnamed protein product [Polarella glacialis]
MFYVTPCHAKQVMGAFSRKVPAFVQGVGVVSMSEMRSAVRDCATEVVDAFVASTVSPAAPATDAKSRLKIHCWGNLQGSGNRATAVGDGDGAITCAIRAAGPALAKAWDMRMRAKVRAFGGSKARPELLGMRPQAIVTAAVAWLGASARAGVAVLAASAGRVVRSLRPRTSTWPPTEEFRIGSDGEAEKDGGELLPAVPSFPQLVDGEVRSCPQLACGESEEELSREVEVKEHGGATISHRRWAEDLCDAALLAVGVECANGVSGVLDADADGLGQQVVDARTLRSLRLESAHHQELVGPEAARAFRELVHQRPALAEVARLAGRAPSEAILRSVRKDWTPRDVAAVQQKLLKIDVASPEELFKQLRLEGPSGMNKRLKAAGQTCLKVETWEALGARGEK